jgi:RND superfamily putative drug exporter
MLNRLAVLAAAAPRRLAGLGLLALIVLAVFGAPALGKLNAQDAFNDPGSQSNRAQTQIQNATGRDAYPKVLALVKAPTGSAAVAHAAAVLRADPAVADVIVPPPGVGSLVSRDSGQTLLPAVLRADINQNTVVDRLTGDFRNDPQVLLGGAVAMVS